MNADQLRQQLDTIQEHERVTLARCRLSGLVNGYVWRAASRQPPLPFWERNPEKGRCRVCGQPTSLDGKPTRLTWHLECTTAYFVWRTPAQYAHALVFRQDGRCAETGVPLGLPARPYLSGTEIDHRIPIYQVRRDRAAEPWFELLRFWSLENLQAISSASHKRKCAEEAAERARNRKVPGIGDLFAAQHVNIGE